MSILNSTCFIRPSPLRMHTSTALSESVWRSDTALHLHSWKSCAAPKSLIYSELCHTDWPLCSKKLLSSHVRVPRQYWEDVKEHCSSTAALTKFFVISQVRCPTRTFNPFPIKFRISFSSLRIANVVGFLIDLENVSTLCWMSGRWWLMYSAFDNKSLENSCDRNSSSTDLCFVVDDFWYEACHWCFPFLVLWQFTGWSEDSLAKRTLIPAYECSSTTVGLFHLFSTKKLHLVCSGLSLVFFRWTSCVLFQSSHQKVCFSSMSSPSGSNR